jgi:hypothetical protein
MTPAANPFAVAAEALRLHSSYQQRAIDACVVAGTTDPASERETLGEIKAALAVFERLAAVDVTLSEQDGIVEPRVFVEARSGPRFYGVSLLHVWQDEDHSQAEVEAVVHIIAALECRRRNEAQP